MATKPRTHARLARSVTPLVLIAGLMVSPEPGLAQAYPDKPIKVIVPAAAGGPTDVPARLASQILPPRLGQPIVVENRPGAGGAIGAKAVATANPDGYTLMAGNTSVFAVIPAVSASAGYDPIKDFAPVAKVSESFQILVVLPSFPAKTAEGISRLRQGKPGQAQLCPHRAGRAAASDRRIVQVEDRHRNRRRILSQRRRSR